MKRDMELVRIILIRTLEANSTLRSHEFISSQDEKEVVLYHLWLLKSEGLIDAVSHEYYGETDWEIKGLTWKGQDFVEAIGDDKVWHKAKEIIFKKLSFVTMEVIRDVCVKVSRELLNL